MPDDLKQALGTVLKSKGSKKFNFLYATGKRKDGKGDGVLMVSAQKLKKDELAETCEVKETLDGVCWSSPDGELAYFKGRSKKLSTMLLGKMMLSVRKETGRGYEFALPPDGISEPSEDSAARNEGRDKETEPENKKTQEETASTGKSPPPAPDPAAIYRKRLEPVLRMYQETIAAQPSQQPVLEKSLKGAMNLAKAGDYLKAVGSLSHLEKVLTKLAGAPKQQPSPPPETETAETETAEPEDLGAAFKEEAATVTAMYVQLLKKFPATKADLEPLAQKLAAAGKARDFAAGLDHCTALRKAMRTAEDKQIDVGGPSRVVMSRSREAYEKARIQARADIGRLRDIILKDPETKDDERFSEIKTAVARLPKLLDGLDDRLITALDVAYRASTPEERVEEARKAHRVVLDYRNALDRVPVLQIVDTKSGYGNFRIYAPLVKMLQDLADRLKG